MTFVRTYDTETAPRGMLRHLLPMFGYPRLIWQNRYTVYNFYRRELMSRFHGSFLGAGWMLVQPLFLFAIYYLIFGVLFGSRGGHTHPSSAFAVFLFSGIIVFHALMEAVGRCVSIVTGNSNLVKKVMFPSEALVVPPTLISLVLWAIGAVVCIGAGLAYGVLQPGWLMLALPLVLLVQFVFTVGLGLFLGNANVFIPDVSNLWRIVSMAWFFVTPIFWPPTLLDGVPVWAANLIRYANPAFPLVMCHRIAIGVQGPKGNDPEVLGEFWPQLGVLSAWAVFFFVIGYTSFVSKKHKFADLV